MSLASIRTTNAAYAPPSTPVAVFVGGTSGIGQATAQAFARYTNGNAHIVIVGRNSAAAAATIASFPPPPSGVAHEFVECDVTLMANVRAVTAGLRARLSKVNFLVLSAGQLSLAGRRDTSEGIDTRLALHYYSRWAFAHGLAPLLEAAGDAGEHASVLSVLLAGQDGPVDLDDLGLRRTYTFPGARVAVSTYNDIMLEEFAERYSTVAFTHSYPGVVNTPLLQPSNWLLRAITSVLLYPFAISAEVCAEYTLYALLNAEKGKLTRRGAKAEDIGAGAYGSEEARLALWKHTEEITGVI